MNADWNGKTTPIRQLQDPFVNGFRVTILAVPRPHVLSRLSLPKHFGLLLQYPWRFVVPIRGNPWSELLPS
jgi:hypothetical protein